MMKSASPEKITFPLMPAKGLSATGVRSAKRHFFTSWGRYMSALICLFCSSAWASPATDRLNSFFKDVRSLRADFQQTMLDARLKGMTEAKGTFVMQRPNNFRWNYEKPYEQTIVADGSKLWIYDKDLEQVTVKALDAALGNTPALLLSGIRPLEEGFRVTELPGKNDGLQWVELLPKANDTSFTRVQLGLGKQAIEVMELVDSFGQTTRLRFSALQVNAKVNSSEFKFVPPQGVDVIEDAPKKN